MSIKATLYDDHGNIVDVLYDRDWVSIGKRIDAKHGKYRRVEAYTFSPQDIRQGRCDDGKPDY